MSELLNSLAVNLEVLEGIAVRVQGDGSGISVEGVSGSQSGKSRGDLACLNGLEVQVVEVRVSDERKTSNGGADGVDDQVEDVANVRVATADLEVVTRSRSSDEAGNTSRQLAVVRGDVAATAVSLSTDGVRLGLQASSEDGGTFDIAVLEVTSSEGNDVEAVESRGEGRSAVSGGWWVGWEDGDTVGSSIALLAVTVSKAVAGSTVVARSCGVAVFARVGAVVRVGSGLNARAGQNRVGRAIAVASSGSGGNCLTVFAIKWWRWASSELVSSVTVGTIFVGVALGADSPEARRDVLSDPALSRLGTDGQSFSAKIVVEVAVEFRSRASKSSVVTAVASGVVSVSFSLALPSGASDRKGENLASVAWWDVADVDLLGSIGAISVVVGVNTVAVFSGLAVSSANVLAGGLIGLGSAGIAVDKNIVTTVTSRAMLSNVASGVTGGSVGVAVFLVLAGGRTVVGDLPGATIDGNWVSV